jgi:hypothetical protein
MSKVSEPLPNITSHSFRVGYISQSVNNSKIIYFIKKINYMVVYPFTYGDDLTQEQANKRLKEVLVGATVVISLYLVIKQAANAANGKPSPRGKLPAPDTSADKGIFDRIIATVSSTCANKTGNFWVGVVCGLAILTVAVMDRSTPKIIESFDSYSSNP